MDKITRMTLSTRIATAFSEEIKNIIADYEEDSSLRTAKITEISFVGMKTVELFNILSLVISAVFAADPTKETADKIQEMSVEELINITNVFTDQEKPT